MRRWCCWRKIVQVGGDRCRLRIRCSRSELMSGVAGGGLSEILARPISPAIPKAGFRTPQAGRLRGKRRDDVAYLDCREFLGKGPVGAVLLMG